MKNWLLDEEVVQPSVRQNIVIDADFDNVDPVTKEYATGLLDYAYNTYGYNAPITSGYRDPERNARVGGVADSWHIKQKAVDLDLSGLTPEQLADVEAKAREKFSEVLYHDAGSGMHLHAANPIQQPSFMDNVAGLLKPAVAEASPDTSQGNWLLDAKQVANVPQQTSGNWLIDEKPTAPVDTTISDAFNEGIYGSIETKDGNIINKLGQAVGSPIEALSALNKPVSALAGTILDLQQQANENPNSFNVDVGRVWDATKNAWVNNDKSLVDVVATKKEQEEYPLAYGALGLVLDAAGDPLRVATPAKAVNATSALLKRIKATDKIADVVRIVSESKGGQLTTETANKILNYEVKGIPLKRWFQEEGILGKEMTEQARAEAALNRRLSDQSDLNIKAEQELIKQGIDPTEAKEIIARGVQARPAVESTMTPDEVVKAYRDKTLNAAIIEGKVDMQDAVDALIAEKNAPAHRVFRAETKAKIDEIKLTSENTINNLRRDMAAEGKSIAEINDAVKAVKESSRAEIASVRALDRVQAIVEASRTGKGTYIADEFLTPQQKKEVAALRKDKAEALAELRESIDPYGLTIDELPDRIAFREARKPIDDYIKPRMDAAYRADDRVVPAWEEAVRIVTSENPTPAVADRFNTVIGKKEFLVSRNPKKKDLDGISRTASTPQVFTVYDDKGNKYVWAGNSKTQGAIEDIIEERYGVKLVEGATGPMSYDVPDAGYKQLFPQEILDIIRYDHEELSRAVKNGEILPQQVVDAVNKAKDTPTLTDVRLAQKKADIQQIVDTQNMAIAELDALKADKKITEEAYKTRIKATKEATKEAIADLALDVKIREIVNKPVVPRVPRGWLDDARQEQLKEIGQEAAVRKRQFADEVDPYGISIDEKTPKQQILDENRRINAETRKTIDDVMTTRGISREQVLAELDGMGITPEVATQVRLAVADTAELMDEMAQLGYQAGMLTDKDMIRYFGGSHLRRSYGMFDNADDWLNKLKEVGTPEEIKAAIGAKQLADSRKDGAGRLGLNLDALIERVPLSKETREKMGQITNSEYLVGKTGQTNVPLFTQAKFFDDVKTRYAVSEEVGFGNDAYKMIPKSAPDKAGRMSFGSLAGQYVPKEIYGDIMIAAGKFSKNPNAVQKAVSYWKIGKLLNPATYMRNIQSGVIAMNTFGKVPITEALPTMVEAGREMLKRGNLYKEARNAGLFHGGISEAELKGALGAGNIASKNIDKLMKLYGKSDDYYRLATYIYHRKAGATIEDAVNIADRALFNYGKVPPLLDALRKNGFVPFGAFPYFAAKETARTLYNDPAAITKYMRAQWRNDGTEEKSVMPEYLKSNTLMRLGKGEREVRGEKQPITSFLDMTYLLPFMNDFSFGPYKDLINAAQGRDYLGRNLTPAADYASFGEKALDRGTAIYNIVAPTLATKSYWDKPYRAVTGTMDDKGRTYSPKEAAAQALLGWKTVNVNVDEEYTKRMQGLSANYRQALSDYNKLNNAAVPDQAEIEQRKKQIMDIVQEMQTIGKNLDKAQKKK